MADLNATQLRQTAPDTASSKRQARRRRRVFWGRATAPLRWILARMPRGLYARALIIIIAPMVLLQSVVAFVFMERHWTKVTERLSRAVVADIAAVMEIIETTPQGEGEAERRQAILRIVQQRLNLNMAILPDEQLPPPAVKPFFSVLDASLSRQIINQINRPFWIDTVGNSKIVEVRIQMGEDVLRIYAPRSHAYASNSHIFLVWMVCSSLVLLIIAVLFLRNQITPIVRLSREMESFGKGQRISAQFEPRGAREVRQASRQFLVMVDRLERQIEQRTTMLAGVSHDLRTMLTRFKLQLALLGQNADVTELNKDVAEMQVMLQGYLDFVRSHNDEPAIDLSVSGLMTKYPAEAALKERELTLDVPENLRAILRPQSFQRLLDNLVSNALRYAHRVAVRAYVTGGNLVIMVDDDGPGIPEVAREIVFKPFHRLDVARNLDESGTGLGLSIARDIARTHGGDIFLDDSPIGGLRAQVEVPL